MKNVLNRKTSAAALVAALLALLLLLGIGCLLRDRAVLGHGLVRLHVVANSDSPEDQSVKLRVKDGVVDYLSYRLSGAESVDDAKKVLERELPALEALAEQILLESGFSEKATVTLCREPFPIRDYETFRLPSGVYQSLRIVIGSGQGHNWWCVVYPNLCNAATTRGLSDASGDAIPTGLVHTISGKPGTQVRFYLLDKLGQVQNGLFRPKE